MIKNVRKEKNDQDVSEFYRFVIWRGWWWCRIESRRFGREMNRLVGGASGVSVRRDLVMFHRVVRLHLGTVARLPNTLPHFPKHRSSVYLFFVVEQFAAAENVPRLAANWVLKSDIQQRFSERICVYPKPYLTLWNADVIINKHSNLQTNVRFDDLRRCGDWA